MRRHPGKERGAESVAREVVDPAFLVRKELGAGLLESVYATCLDGELRYRGLDVEREAPVSVTFRGRRIDVALRADLVVGGKVIVETKSVRDLHPVHEAQILTYMRLSGCPIGFLINLSEGRSTDGTRRFVL